MQAKVDELGGSHRRIFALSGARSSELSKAPWRPQNPPETPGNPRQADQAQRTPLLELKGLLVKASGPAGSVEVPSQRLHGADWTGCFNQFINQL